MYPLIVELELWTLPRSTRLPLDGKEVAKRCQHETRLPSTVVLGLNFIPDPIDVKNLRNSLATREFSVDEFLKFCVERGLEQNSENERSAAEFLAFVQGQAVAWLNLPAENLGLGMARTLVEWANMNNMHIRDGETTYEPLTSSQVYARWPSGDA